MKPFLLGLPVLMLCFTGTAAETTSRVKTTLVALEYNSVAARYVEKPTFAQLTVRNNNPPYLLVSMGTFKLNETNGKFQHSLLYQKQKVEEYVSAIDKYLEWEKLATSRKDAFTKEIRWVKGIGAGIPNLRFSFHSGNEGHHYLEVVAGGMGMAVADTAQYYDRDNAIALKNLLLALASDSIPKLDVDSVYK